MKSILPLFFLLFLYTPTAAPIPSEHNKVLLERNLHYPFHQCGLISFLGWVCKHSSLTSKLRNTYFPFHQLSLLHPLSASVSVADRRLSEEGFNNAPISPPTAVRPSTALTANVPLESSYLQSLSVQSSVILDLEPESETDALPAKPTSALPQLRAEDLEQYWASLQGNENGFVQDMDLDDRPTIPSPKYSCRSNHNMTTGSLDSRAIDGQPKCIEREYSDLLAVGIIVLFLCAVTVWEAIGNIGNL